MFSSTHEKHQCAYQQLFIMSVCFADFGLRACVRYDNNNCEPC